MQLWVLVLTADGPERPCRCIGPFSTEEAALAHGAGLDLPGGGYQVAPLTPVGTVMLR